MPPKWPGESSGYRRRGGLLSRRHARRAGETSTSIFPSLLFNVFSEYEPGNLLLRQYQEVMEFKWKIRLQHAPKDPAGKIIIRFPEN